MKAKKTLRKFTPGRGYTKKDWDDVSDNPEWTPAMFKKAKPFAEVFPEMALAIKRSRGRPRIDAPKAAVTLRLDPKTLAKFKQRGDDWRAKMAKVLDKAKV